jgi:hypothetical protein
LYEHDETFAVKTAEAAFVDGTGEADDPTAVRPSPITANITRTRVLRIVSSPTLSETVSSSLGQTAPRSQ